MPTLIAGPCVLEDMETCRDIAWHMKGLCATYGVPYIFKGSFDKANRSRLSSPRGPGHAYGMHMLDEVRGIGVKVITDIHTPEQAGATAPHVDWLQIPAGLSRQTDLVVAAGLTGKDVLLKKGQGMTVHQALDARGKMRDPHDAVICLRGNTYGSGDLVMDFRDLVDLNSAGVRTAVDVTHSVAGNRGRPSMVHDYTLDLARAAVAIGVEAIFAEVHPDPTRALCDGDVSLPLMEAEELVRIVAGRR